MKTKTKKVKSPKTKSSEPKSKSNLVQDTKKIKFSDEEIDSLKTIFSDKEIIEQEKFDELKKLKESMNEVNLGILFRDCFNILEINCECFKDEEKDYSKKLNLFLKSFDVNEIRSLLRDYGNGKEYGDYLIERNIKRIVEANRDKYLELINFFFKIGSDE
jgi:hypothetical protein